ncbi:hypothetical protein AKUH4B114J_01070 [Apilactobacillus kunkeei]|nr:hypothetical protein AKUH4B102A_00980 [Apilactobacillus kunkeei]CAI2553360.1 hypothetical protein AKUH4B405J_00980 [Apilactobacillus kunkeei]CAI2553632.1 hypothetical protein AKUH3B101X_01060 [Apilactobacillus kunkeei]CAI2554080.1 hypothetical protein AKUH4B410M_00980 [Apilactobacillus kunkeei]CAI2554308.1 hypothetical protein AKUH3B202M_01060 [Apilactobacillus kunkeei]
MLKNIILIIEKGVGRVSQERIRTRYPAIYEYEHSHTSEETARAFGILLEPFFIFNLSLKRKSNYSKNPILNFFERLF